MDPCDLKIDIQRPWFLNEGEKYFRERYKREDSIERLLVIAGEYYDKNPHHNYMDFDFSILCRDFFEVSTPKAIPKKVIAIKRNTKNRTGDVKGYFVINLVYGKDIPKGDANSSDPYAVFEFPDGKKKTSATI